VNNEKFFIQHEIYAYTTRKFMVVKDKLTNSFFYILIVVEAQMKLRCLEILKTSKSFLLNGS